MLLWGNKAAEPEYAAAKIMVWWDMKDCPIPDGYDPRRLRPSIVGALKKLGYSGPVSITAYGDQKQTPAHLLRGLSSSGVAVAHTMSGTTCSVMYSDMLDWRSRNPPPATMMIISNQVEDVFSWDLVRLQQDTKYNLVLAMSYISNVLPDLDISAEWRWNKLLGFWKPPLEFHEQVNLPAMFICKTCKIHVQSLLKFRMHLSSKKHALEVVRNPTSEELDPVTRFWGRNYAAKPEYATAKIVVWWDMGDCPIPDGYDPCRIRPSIECAFKKLGYSGPVSITAYGDQRQTPHHILGGLSSTGVAVAHALVGVRCKRMFSDMLDWQEHNPPPATMMLISDHLDIFSKSLARLQQRTKYNLFLAYSFRPYKMSILVTSAEWLWDSLLAETGQHVLRRNVLRKCTSDERGESTGMFHCKSCFCDCKSLDHFRLHLSSQEHAQLDCYIDACIQLAEEERQLWLDREVKEKFAKRTRLRKASRTGFRPFHNHLRLKSQTFKKERVV